MKKGYGFDRLSRDILILAVFLGALSVVVSFCAAGPALAGVAALLTGTVLYRSVSMKIERRQDELLGYEKLVSAVSGFFGRIFKKKEGADRDPAYKYFKCPNCKQRIRAPKGRGHIRVTCTSCGTKFDKTV